MPSRRDQIVMSDEEMQGFLEEQKVMQVATLGRSGRPHMTPLWFVPHGTELRGWTYAKSQKARNLERDRRATLQLESGVAYGELRGMMLRCETVIHRDTEAVVAVGADLTERYGGTGVDPEAFGEAVRAQAAKRVALEFRERERVTWDHAKLAGVY
jgi:hypothetical protein